MHDSIIIKGAREHNLKNVSVTLPRNRMIVFTGLSGSGKSSLAFDHIDVDKSVVKVSIVGAGMVDNAGVAAKMFGALYDADINIHMISTSEIKISVIIDEADADKAVAAIHDAFIN